MLCALCEPITIAHLRDNDYKHHRNLTSLKVSAEETKCDLCILLWQCLVRSVQPKSIAPQLQGTQTEHDMNMTDSMIRLTGEILDMGQPSLNELKPSKIWVYSGPKAEFGMGGTTVYAHLELYAPRGEKYFE